MKKVIVVSMVGLLLVAGLVFAERASGAMRAQMAERRLGGGPGGNWGWGRGQGMKGEMGPGMFLALADKLELTDQQKAQLQKMQEDFQLQRVDARAKIEKAQIKLHALMRDPASPEREVLASIDEVAQLKADLAKMQFTHMRQCRSVLTDKQLDTLKQLRKDRLEGRSNRWQQQPPMQGMGPHRQGRSSM
jgi:Spy/CpxP family protein refolding chaperone